MRLHARVIGRGDGKHRVEVVDEAGQVHELDGVQSAKVFIDPNRAPRVSLELVEFDLDVTDVRRNKL